MSECVDIAFERPLKKKRGSQEEYWGDRLIYWLHSGNEGDIAGELGVPSLSSFFGVPGPPSTDQLRAMQAFGAPPADPLAGEARWFDAATGLASVRALLAFAHQYPQRVEGPARWGARAAENLIPDLESLEQALVAADREGVRFCLRA